jgi:hypothetical protein
MGQHSWTRVEEAKPLEPPRSVAARYAICRQSVRIVESARCRVRLGVESLEV